MSHRKLSRRRSFLNKIIPIRSIRQRSLLFQLQKEDSLRLKFMMFWEVRLRQLWKRKKIRDGMSSRGMRTTSEAVCIFTRYAQASSMTSRSWLFSDDEISHLFRCRDAQDCKPVGKNSLYGNAQSNTGRGKVRIFGEHAVSMVKFVEASGNVV